jgi:hypothetical protein
MNDKIKNEIPWSEFSTSQIFENFLVWDFFKRKNKGFFIEVGANYPFIRSQTWLLEHSGWQGILVEPLSECCELLKKLRKNSRVFQVAVTSPSIKLGEGGRLYSLSLALVLL